MIEAILARHGRLDILVNNAGIGGNTPFLDITLEEWNRTIAINLTGAFLVAQAAPARWRSGGAARSSTSPRCPASAAATAAPPTASAKAGLELLTKVMAVELAEHGINVNAIAPGAIETEMAKFAHDAGDARRLQLPDPDDALRHAGGDRRRGRLPVLRREPLRPRPHPERGRRLSGGRPHVPRRRRPPRRPDFDQRRTEGGNHAQEHHAVAASRPSRAARPSRRRCRCATPTPPSTASRSAPTCRRPTRSTSTSPGRPSR